MTDVLVEIHTAALGAMALRPKAFGPRATTEANDHPGADLCEDTFRERLADSEGALASLWKRSLTAWDFAEQPEWSVHPPRTDERRADTYARLCFDYDLRKALDEAVPVSRVPGIDKISTDFEPWYTRESANSRAFYWPAYERYLRETKGWDETSIATLNEASHSVVERLSDPERTEAFGARGLVVGYVQSGKTANFTGVTAKAIDAGYRLVIILGGTLNLLRGQTQRRMDMELVGQENILRRIDPADIDSLVSVDYQDDEDWPAKFVEHGGQPSLRGAFDIERLTTRDGDYKSLNQGISTLEFEKKDRNLPLYAPENLHDAAARLLVVKKNKSVLTKLVTDLKKIGPILSQIPALIIDDESDQASVNTTDPKKWEAGEVSRSAINGLISDLLKLLPRAQYVGYTATPFANVFVNPSDDHDIFPRHFLISLPPPVGYMGVQDFHDLDSPIPMDERTVANSQEKAHIRGIHDSTGDRLQEAMDAFMLSGALKLYRAANGVPEEAFRHHTMLVHESVRTDDHKTLADRINARWRQSGYTGPAGHTRLSALFESDFRQVSGARGTDRQGKLLPFPMLYADLMPYVSRARQLINSGGGPVVIVNGDTDSFFSQIDLDFDRTPNVWKILVGGTKLSRGFTVEGLTVTYYRRTTRQADTLMQMGRWFGFRPGYQDLVRLYIGREEAYGRNKTVDLYEAFEANCRDEETFREQLKLYATLIDGQPQITPAEIPPLVSQHLAWLKPSARNKMFNAELVEIRSPGQPIEPAAYPQDSRMTERNTKRWHPVLGALTGQKRICRLLPESASRPPKTFQASTAHVPHAELLSVLSSLEWEGENRFAPHLAYLAQLDGTLAKVDDWLVISPHRAEEQRHDTTVLGYGPFSLARRSRQPGKPSFGRISGKEHRDYAQQLIDAASSASAISDPHSVGPNQGVALLYPVVEASNDADMELVAANHAADLSQIIMAFMLIPPRAAIDSKRRLLRFRAKDPNCPRDILVNVSR